ncbi:MAG: hypothetical protein KJ914_18725 [Gammaproteobacteria bacterium]|nr:hypothetical protein [Gammaproteobacteria bacterium]MBU1716521.1 hypothetical protein [Pseudomonadota bacterium]
MTPLDALIELLDRVAANRGATVLVNDEELRQWPTGALKALKAQKLITKTRPATNAICPGCEEECAMPVHTLPGKQGASASFIVCDKRSDINRVAVPAERLIQWQCSADLICEFIATSLGLRRSDRQTASTELWEIGIATGDKRTQMLCLQNNDEFNLVAGDKKVPLAEVVEYQASQYSLGREMIRRLIDSVSTADPRYTPSNVKREARKLDTQAMYESWRKKYRELKRTKPGKTDKWYAHQIFKIGIAQGRSVETIRKQMKG